MMQGTTPTHTWFVPIGANLIRNARVTYKQKDDIVLTKEGNDFTITSVDSNRAKISCKLTQEDTLKLDHEAKVKIQLHLLTTDGNALITHVYTRKVGECLAGEVLS